MTYAVYGDSAYPYGTATRYYGVGADTSLRWGVDVDWNGDGVYDGTNDGIYAVDFSCSRGRTAYLNIDADGEANGFEPVRVGRATLMLDNTTRRFDPFNTASALYPNVLPGRYVRVRNLYNGTTSSVFHGKIKNITNIDTDRDQLVRLELEDGMQLLQKADTFIAIQQSIDTDDAIQLVLSYVGWPTLFGTSLEDASDIIPYWWADDRASTEIRRLAEAELGEFFIASNGNATFLSRHNSAASVLTLTSADFLKDIDVPQPLEVVRNSVKLYAHPRTLIATGTLWELGDAPSIAAGASLTIWATYQYSNDTVPAINVVNPVVTTDFTANTQAGGGGTDLSSSFSVVLTDFGKTGKLVITNNHGSLAGYLTLLKVRGDALAAPDPSLLIQENSASQTTYGQATFKLDNLWLQNTSLTNDFAKWLISYLPTPQRFLTVSLEGRPDIQFTPDLFSILDVTITKLGITNVNYQVAGIEHEWISDNGQAVRTTWILEPKTSLSSYWQFTTQLDVTSIFGI